MDQLNNLNVFGKPERYAITEEGEIVAAEFFAIKQFYRFMTHYMSHDDSYDDYRARYRGEVCCFMDYVAMWMIKDDAIQYFANYEEYMRTLIGLQEVSQIENFSGPYWEENCSTMRTGPTGDPHESKDKAPMSQGFYFLNWGKSPVCDAQYELRDGRANCVAFERDNYNVSVHKPHLMDKYHYIWLANVGEIDWGDVVILSPLRFTEGYGLRHKALTHKFFKKCRKDYRKKLRAQQQVELQESEEQSQIEVPAVEVASLP